MKRFPWLILALFATAAAFAAAPTPAELGAQAIAFLQTGRDIHVVHTGFFLDGGSSEVTLADATGQTLDLIMLNRRRAQREGGIFGAYEPKHHREYLPTGDAQAAFKSALIAALRRSSVTNPDTQTLLDGLTSLFPTYGDDVHWSGTRTAAAGPLISRHRALVFGGAILVLAFALAVSLRRPKRPVHKR